MTGLGSRSAHSPKFPNWHPKSCALCGKGEGALLKFTLALAALGAPGVYAHAACVRQREAQRAKS